MHQLSDAAKNSILHIIREHSRGNLCKQDFADFCFDLFEDISGMEAIPVAHAVEIINDLWNKYCGQAKRRTQTP